jgi:hypothetical protein
MTPYQIQKLLKIRKAMERELEVMASTPRIAKAVEQSREGQGRGSHLRAAQSSVRMVEGLDKMLYSAGKIKKLPKPKYPGGKRV